jgi:monoterpene epsilon-lactone hydrolase
VPSPQFEKLVQILHDRRRPPGLDVGRLRAGMEATAFPVPGDAEVVTGSLGGVDFEVVSTPGADPDRTLLYLHGGGFVMGSPNTHRKLAADLSRAAGVRVMVPDYPLAPEHPFPAAIEAITSLYTALLATGGPADRIAIGGDSAGGGLTVATLLAWRDRGLVLPAAALVISPWVDLTGAEVLDPALVERDPICSPESLDTMGRWYLADADPRQPLVSPVLADLTGFPPLLIHVGEAEILVGGSRALAERAAAAGVDVTLDVWPDMIHVWHVFAGRVPESTDAVERAGAWIAKALV